MILFEKFGQHQPLNQQTERYALEGVPVSLSTLADAVGADCAALEALLRRVETHVMAAERLHGDNTTVPVLVQPGDAGSAPGARPQARKPSRSRRSPSRWCRHRRPVRHLATDQRQERRPVRQELSNR